jgi:hypothetical protein
LGLRNCFCTYCTTFLCLKLRSFLYYCYIAHYKIDSSWNKLETKLQTKFGKEMCLLIARNRKKTLHGKHSNSYCRILFFHLNVLLNENSVLWSVVLGNRDNFGLHQSMLGVNFSTKRSSIFWKIMFHLLCCLKSQHLSIPLGICFCQVWDYSQYLLKIILTLGIFSLLDFQRFGGTEKSNSHTSERGPLLSKTNSFFDFRWSIGHSNDTTLCLGLSYR